MRLNRFLFPVFLYSSLAPVLHADNATLEQMKKDLYFLASDECEGRGLKTEGINKAADYIAKEFKAAGLKSPFPNGYFQPFSVKEFFLEAGPHHFTLNGAEFAGRRPGVQQRLHRLWFERQGHGGRRAGIRRVWHHQPEI